MRRRDFLAVLGTTVTGLAGCVADPSPGGGATSNRTSVRDRSPGATATTGTTRAPTEAGQSPTASPEQSTTTSCNPPDVENRWVRCRGDPVSASRTVIDEPGYDDNKKYYPGNSTVRVVTHVSGDDPAGFANWSFERWGSFEAADVAIEKARAVTERRLGSGAFWSALGDLPDSADVEGPDGSVIQLGIETTFEDCEVDEPPVTLSEFADLAPRSVNATVTLEGTEHSEAVPVYANHRLRRGGWQ